MLALEEKVLEEVSEEKVSEGASVEQVAWPHSNRQSSNCHRH